MCNVLWLHYVALFIFKAPCPCRDEGYDSKDGVEIDTFLESSAPSYEFIFSSFSRWRFRSLKGSVNLRNAIIYDIPMLEKHAPRPKDLLSRTDVSVWTQGAYMKSLHLTMY